MSRILISYLSQNSGHHSAAKALECAFKMLDPSCETCVVDVFAHMTPRLSAVVDKLYMVTIRRTPEVWDSLYDSPWLEQMTRRLRRLIQSGESESLHDLVSSFEPDAIVCTQAHSLGVLSSYLQHRNKKLPIWGVVTDYIPHRFWVVDGPAHYSVATESAARRLILLGIPRERVHVLGIPIHPQFVEAAKVTAYSYSLQFPRVLVMGGSRGLGVRYRTIKSIDKSPVNFALDIVTGMNRRLRARLLRHRRDFIHRTRIRGFVRNMVPLMQRATVLVSKPGGLTAAEAMALGIPMVIVRPLPGQEQNNARVLVGQGCAVSVESDADTGAVLTALLRNEAILSMMRERALRLGRADAALATARAVLEQVRSKGA